MTTIFDDAVQQDTVYALAQSTDHLYAARLSGLYRSADGGLTWLNTFASLDQPLAATAVTAVGSTVFAGVNGAVLRSDDNGESWHMIGLSSPPPHLVALAASPHFSEDGVILAGTADDGVFVSTDRGISWTAWNFGLLDLHIFALAISPDFSRDQTVFAGTESGIFRSHNGGRGWRELPFPIEAAPVLSLALSPAYVTDRRLYAGTENNGLYLSDDGGLNWRAGDNTHSDTAVNAIQITATPAADIWLLLENQLLCSSDKGQTWIRRHRLPTDKLAMALLVSKSVLVGFADGTILQLR